MLSQYQIDVNIAKLKKVREKRWINLKYQAEQGRQASAGCRFSQVKTLQSKAANPVHFVNADLNLQGLEVTSF